MAERVGRIDAEPPPVTRDRFLGGRLTLAQPAKGHRAGTDAILLAAAAPPSFVGRAVDVGAGVGAAGLAFAVAAPHARVTLVERDPFAAGLAGENVAANGFADRVEVAHCDLFTPDERFALRGADLVLTNPPFYEAAHARASPDAARRRAHVLDQGVTLADWLRACLGLLAPGSTLIVVHAPAAVPDMCAALQGVAGAITLMGVHPRVGAPAHRVLLRAIKGSRAPFALAPPLVLHEGEGFTPEAARLHRGEAPLAW